MPMAPLPTTSSDFGKAFRHHGFLVGPDVLAVGLQARQGARPCAGREEDVRRRQGRRFLAVLQNGQLALAGEPAVAVEHRDLVLLHQVFDAGIEPRRDPARALDHLGDIEGDIVRRQAEIAGMLHQMVDLRGAQQRLGRDAAPVEADAAEMFALDQRRVQAELRRTDRRHITARPAADDDEIEAGVGFIGHSSPYRRCRLRRVGGRPRPLVYRSGHMHRPCRPSHSFVTPADRRESRGPESPGTVFAYDSGPRISAALHPG